MRLNVVLVDYLEQNVHYWWLDVGSKGHELAVDTMKDSFQVVSLTGILTIKKFQEAADEVVWHLLDDHILTQMNGEDEF